MNTFPNLPTTSDLGPHFPVIVELNRWGSENAGAACQFREEYSGSSILRPCMGLRKCGLILQVVLKNSHLTQKIAVWNQIKWSYNQGWS